MGIFKKGDLVRHDDNKEIMTVVGYSDDGNRVECTFDGPDGQESLFAREDKLKPYRKPI